MPDNGKLMVDHSKTSQPSLNQILIDIQRKYGPQAIQVANRFKLEQQYLSTGIDELDSWLGGGLLQGKINAIIGKPTSGSQTLAYTTIANAQRLESIIVLVDAQGLFDPSYAAQCGINLSTLFIVHPQSDIETLELTSDLAVTGVVDLIVTDGLFQHHQLRRIQSLSTTHTTLLLVAQQPTHVAQLEFQVRCKKWLYRHQRVIGCQIQAQLTRHLKQTIGKQIHFPMYFPSNLEQEVGCDFGGSDD